MSLMMKIATEPIITEDAMYFDFLWCFFMCKCILRKKDFPKKYPELHRGQFVVASGWSNIGRHDDVTTLMICSMWAKKIKVLSIDKKENLTNEQIDIAENNAIEDFTNEIKIEEIEL